MKKGTTVDQSYSKSLETTGGPRPHPKPGQVVIHGGVLGRGRAAGESQRAQHLKPLALEEDDVFFAHFFLVEWGKGPHGQEGGTLGGRVLHGWAGRLAGEVWKTEDGGVGSHQALRRPRAWVAGLTLGGCGAVAAAPDGTQ